MTQFALPRVTRCPPNARCHPPFLPASLSLTLLFTISVTHIFPLPVPLFPSRHPRAHRSCDHIILLTEARHGSTWLLDSVERCRYSRKEYVEHGVFGENVYDDTELWHLPNTTLYNVTVPDVVQYLRNNSVKLFPHSLAGARVGELLRATRDARDGASRGASETGAVPVVVLRRSPLAACCSLRRARETGDWAIVKALSATHAECVCDEKCVTECQEWVRETENYFADVARLLHRVGVAADWLWYEDVENRPVVELRKGRCEIRNCNFE